LGHSVHGLSLFSVREHYGNSLVYKCHALHVPKLVTTDKYDLKKEQKKRH